MTRFLHFSGHIYFFTFFGLSSLLGGMFNHHCLDTCAVFGVLHARVVHFGIYTCSALLVMFYTEKRSRNAIIILIIIVTFFSLSYDVKYARSQKAAVYSSQPHYLT